MLAPTQSLSLLYRVIDVFLPPDYLGSRQIYPVLLMNDGQDMNDLNMVGTLDALYREGRINKVIAVGIHAGNRLSEYGTAGQPDYQKRGGKARAYTNFVVTEALPFISRNYRTYNGLASYTFAGFSLGGLSALDISWNYPRIFGKVGIFFRLLLVAIQGL